MVKTYAQLYLDARKALSAAETPQDAATLARHLLCHVSGKSREQLLADQQLYASEEVCGAMNEVVNRTLCGEPLAYILGNWEFYGLPMIVDKNVLIPRDDTCAVTTLAIERAQKLPQSPRILDLCTGSGCIGLAIAGRIKDARVTLADISPEALAVAKKNITLNKLSARVSCVTADALGTCPAFLGKFDLIVSNPPYITTAEMALLPVSVADYEPHLALHGGDDGLDFYRSIIENYTAALKLGGYMCFEFGFGQGSAVCELLQAKGYTILERSRDYNDRDRAVIAQYGKEG